MPQCNFCSMVLDGEPRKMKWCVRRSCKKEKRVIASDRIWNQPVISIRELILRVVI